MLLEGTQDPQLLRTVGLLGEQMSCCVSAWKVHTDNMDPSEHLQTIRVLERLGSGKDSLKRGFEASWTL